MQKNRMAGVGEGPLRWLGIFGILFLTLVGRGHGQNQQAPQAWQHPAQIFWNDKPLAEAEAAARSGDAKAQYYLAWINWSGERGQTNHAEAFHWFYSAATNGVAEAQLKMGVLCERGIGRPTNVEEAGKWYRLAAQQSNVVARLRLAYIERGSDYPNRVKAVADEEYGPACHQMTGWSRADEVAAVYCLKAANQGVADAQYMLCNRLMTGRGMAKDMTEAFKWLSLAVAAGDPAATSYLKDERSIFSTAEQAEGQRRANAFRPLVIKSEWEHSERLYHDASLSWPEAAGGLESRARRGDAAAQYRLGVMLCHLSRFDAANKIIRQPGSNRMNPAAEFSVRDKTALKWVLMAASQDHLDALYQAGIMYLNGFGTVTDFVEAQRWFLKAASLGHRDAQYQAARLFERSVTSGTGFTEALHLHRVAAAAGQPESTAWLKEFIASSFPSGATGTVVTTSSVVTNADQTVRVAIVTTDRRLQDIADLLGVFWSRQPGVMLLERDQIERVLREQALSAGQKGAKVQLGQLLGADGVIFLDLMPEGASNRLGIQLVATKPGVIVAQAEESWPVKNLEVWAGLMAVRQAAFLPKLSVSKTSAVPLSLLNFNSAIATPEGAKFERMFTELLLRRLMQQPELFVLERKRLEKLADEKLYQRTDETFWNGSLVLDGTIDREGVQAGQMTLHLRVTRPEGNPQEIALTAPREEPLKLVEAAAVQIVKSLDANAKLKGWDPLAEAVRYFDESRWQMAHNSLVESQRAAETAWALGFRSMSLAEMRIAAYVKELPADPVIYEDQSIKKMPRPPMPVEAQVDKAVLAARYYLEQAARMGTNAPPENWVKLGEAVLLRTSTQLSWIHQRMVHVRGKIVRPESLREMSREMAGYLAKYSVPTRLDNGISYDWLELRYGMLWEEDVTAGLKRYDDALCRGQYLAVSLSSLGRMPYILPMLSWQDHSAENMMRLEKEFLERWEGKDTLLGGLTVRLMTLKRSSPENYETKFRELLGFLGENQHDFGADVTSYMENLPSLVDMLSRQIGYNTPLRRKYDGEFKPALNAKLVPVLAQVREQRNIVQVKQLAARMDRAAETGEAIDASAIHGTMMLGWNETAAKLILPSLLRYEAAIPPGNVFAGFVRGRVGEVFRKIGETVPPSPRVVAKASPPPVPSLKPPQQNTIPEEEVEIDIKLPTAPKPRTPQAPLVLNLEESVKLLPSRDELGFAQSVFVAGCMVAGDHFWAEVWNTAYSAGRMSSKGELISYNLRDRSKRVYSMPEGFRSKQPSYSYYYNGDQGFVVKEGKVLYLDDDTVWELGVVKGEWSKTAWKLPSRSRLHSAHDRLFVSAPESISELLADGSVRVLASNRRRPAFTPLDETLQLNRALMMASGEDGLRIIVGGKVVDYLLDRNRWRSVGVVPESGMWRTEICGQGMLFSRSSQFGYAPSIHALLPDQTEIIPLVAAQNYAADTCRWIFPSELKADDQFFHYHRALAVETDSLWCWYHPSSPPGKPAATVREEHRLVFFKKGVQQPLVAQLRYHPKDTVPSESLSSPPVLFATGTHLALLHRESGRMWWLKKSVVESRSEDHVKGELAAQKERLDYLTKRLSYWRQVSDMNGNRNGKLEPDEYALMQLSQGYKQDLIEIEKLAQASK
ncbi:MAG TPA: tetratricopeptide repeat protein [Verrucomicrobiae bacterium]